MSCRGTCTVRIFNVTRELTVYDKPPHIDQATALRVLKGALNKETAPEKETGCQTAGCECTPMADYMPDAKGKRKKEPDWSEPTVYQFNVNVGPDEHHIEFVAGHAQIQSAIVPGLCEKGRVIIHLQPTPVHDGGPPVPPATPPPTFR